MCEKYWNEECRRVGNGVKYMHREDVFELIKVVLNTVNVCPTCHQVINKENNNG